MPRTNPFTPTFGQIPPFMAGRSHIVEELLRAFGNGAGDPNLSTIFVGARGTGKTALLTYLSEEAAPRGWVTASVSAVPGMLEDIIERARESSREFLEQEGSARLKGVTVAQLFGVEWEHRDNPEGNWRTRMNKILDALNEHGVGLLITVDEVQVDLDEMVQLAAVYQHFVRERRGVALLMAGLPAKVSSLLRHDSISFLRRANYYQLGKIDDGEIESAFRMTIENAGKAITQEACVAAVQAIDGFPYMMQLVGYRAWYEAQDSGTIAKEHVEAAIGLAERDIRNKILDTTYNELSDGDAAFLRAMLQDEACSSISDIAQRMGVRSNYASQYRIRLLEHGVIEEARRGKVSFAIPRMREYLEEKLL